MYELHLSPTDAVAQFGAKSTVESERNEMNLGQDNCLISLAERRAIYGKASTQRRLPCIHPIARLALAEVARRPSTARCSAFGATASNDSTSPRVATTAPAAGSNSMEETWKPVVGFDSYEVSNLGRVRYVRVLSPSVTRYGYHRVSLVRDGAPTRGHHVHRLVLGAFVGPCPPGMEGCHNNGVRTDNRIENLRWDTRVANFVDRELHGNTARGQRNGNSRLTAEQVKSIRSMEGKYPAAFVAEMMDSSAGTICNIWRRKTWTHLK